MNWFPLGLTYATFYMGRYNLNVASSDIMETFALSKAEFGTIATAGFWTYALSVIFNGPLADRIGGKKAILFGGIGAALFNLVIGVLFLAGWQTKIVVGMSLLYAVNQYFQSFGALSVVKVNAPWFHVQERGVFGGIFGIMISSGYFLAMGVGGWILAHFGWNWVFIVPSALILVMVLVDFFLVSDKPEQCGFAKINTDDATCHLGDDVKVGFTYVAEARFRQPGDPHPDGRRVLHRLRAPGADALVHAVPQGGPPHRPGLRAAPGGLAGHHAGRHRRRAALRLHVRPPVPVAAAAGGLHLLHRPDRLAADPGRRRASPGWPRS